jgi:hypothetical protein
LAFAKDSKDAYSECFGSFFEVFNGKSLVITATDELLELSNFTVTSCQDLSSGWKTTHLGGGCQSTEYFCPQCVVSRKTIGDHKIGSNRCTMGTRLGIIYCYCHDVVNDKVLESTKQQLTSYVQTTMDDGFKHFDGIMKQK